MLTRSRAELGIQNRGQKPYSYIKLLGFLNMQIHFNASNKMYSVCLYLSMKYFQ
jgi:hypothetical protein